jgi:hypothetical protein
MSRVELRVDPASDYIIFDTVGATGGIPLSRRPGPTSSGAVCCARPMVRPKRKSPRRLGTGLRIGCRLLLGRCSRSSAHLDLFRLLATASGRLKGLTTILLPSPGVLTQ